MNTDSASDYQSIEFEVRCRTWRSLSRISSAISVQVKEDGATATATLTKSDEMVFMGEEKDGYLKVQGSTAEGWVRKTLVAKK